MLEVPLSQGLVALVDDEDAERVLAVGKWYADRMARTYYARKNFYAGNGKYTQLKMHRFLTGWAIVDHINGDGLDNRRSNLREVTHQQNAQNRRLRKDNKAGYKGVYYNKQRKGYVASIMFSGESIDLGRYPDPATAAKAYDEAALSLFGPYARINFPKETNT